MDRTLDEIHKIREKIYEEEKGLSNKEVLDRLHKRVENIIKDRNLKLKYPEEKLVSV